MTIESLECINVILSKILSAGWAVDSNEDLGKAFIILVVIDCNEHVLKDLLLGEDGVIKSVKHMQDEQMSNFICNHFFQWFLYGFKNNFPVFGFENVK